MHTRSFVYGKLNEYSKIVSILKGDYQKSSNNLSSLIKHLFLWTMTNQWGLELVTSPVFGSGWQICLETCTGDPSPDQF